ncbi:MAG: AraC family transcriptional regulator [Anaerolineae bacterium]
MDLACEERPSDSPYVEMIWRGQGISAGSFTSMAEIHCGLVVTKLHGHMTITVRGPETRPSPAYCPPDAEFFGILFKPGAYMPRFPAQSVMDRKDVNLPNASSTSFWLGSAAWEFPNFENIDTFLKRLVRHGLLIHDPVVEQALHGRPADMSVRTAQRHILRASGMTLNTIRQIERARHAARLLQGGTSILDTVVQAGYFDQPHLTRSLKHYIGQTPAQLINPNRAARLSFLYKTSQIASAMIQMFDLQQEQPNAETNRIGISVGGWRHRSAGDVAFPLRE